MTLRIDSTSLYGTLNLLVLSALSDGLLHGLAILRRIVDGSNEAPAASHCDIGAPLHPRPGLLAIAQ